MDAMNRWILGLVSVIAVNGFSQEVDLARARQEGPKFYFDALTFASEDTMLSRLDVYIQIPFDALRFVQVGNGYDASYEQTVSIFDIQKNLVGERLSIEKVRQVAFTETTDPNRYDLTQRFFTLTPGQYTIDVQIRDLETRKSWHQAREILVRNMHEARVTVSDLMLVSQLRAEGEKRSIVPNISGNVANLPEGFHVFCEVYNYTPCDTLKLTYTVKTAKQEDLLISTLSHSASQGRNRIFMRIDSRDLPMGRYVVSLRVDACAVAGLPDKLFTFAQRPFNLQWRGIPTSVGDLDLAIDQLMYIAEHGELERIRAAQTAEEKRNRFREFWKKRDPTPETDRNEAMENYYLRVDYANRNFASYIDGWRTDRGMVYIIYGEPNTIDRYPFNLDSRPYEIWHYYDINRRFIFVDHTGFGDYRLDPSTPAWDRRRRGR